VLMQDKTHIPEFTFLEKFLLSQSRFAFNPLKRESPVYH